MMYYCILLTALLGAALPFVALWLVVRLKLPKVSKGTIAFFHPAAHGGGGGERVLWTAVDALAGGHPSHKICIFCAAATRDTEALLAKVRRQFDLTVRGDGHQLEVLPLQHTRLLEPSAWPRCTLLGQTLGSALVAWSALRQVVPEVWIDTAGWPGAYPLAAVAGSRVACYVHYPVISTDMLQRIWRREASWNNAKAFSTSRLAAIVKAVYYCAFAALYACLGAIPACVMVNSTWTLGHIRSLWWRWPRRATALVFPPCDVSGLAELPLRKAAPKLTMCSVAQFRPEKNHCLQLEALALALRQRPGAFELIVVGGCRDADDWARLRHLQEAAGALDIASAVRWRPNASYGELKEVLRAAAAGLHSMRDEHFGISVVEYMAAGCIAIAHDSGGPRQDIVQPARRAGGGEDDRALGFLASTAAEYAACMLGLADMTLEHRQDMALRAREQALRFSSASFRAAWLKATSCVVSEHAA